jgi:hypothetical protein
MVDTVVVQSAATESSEDPKHVEAMLAKVDAANAAAADTSELSDLPTQDSAQERPQWLPEKFKSPEDLVKAYSELERKLGGKKEDTPAEPPKAAEGDPSKATQDDAAQELASKGLNLDDFSSEFQKTGSLSAESYEKLEKAGYPRAYVDTYIAGQQALAAQFQSEVKTAAGGDEGFAAMVEWAAANADPKDIAAYNKAIDSGDIDQAKLAVAGMYQKFQQAHPEEPRLIAGSGGRVTGDSYESIAQMQEDMKNPLYKTDPAFRKKVVDKLGRSNIL